MGPRELECVNIDWQWEITTFYLYDTETSGYIKGSGFLEQLSKYKLQACFSGKALLQKLGSVRDGMCFVFYPSFPTSPLNWTLWSQVRVTGKKKFTYSCVKGKPLWKCSRSVGDLNVCVIVSTQGTVQAGWLAEIDGCPVKFGCWLQRERERDWNYQSTDITVLQQMMPTC
jgi:hypothetical protein